MWVRLTIAKIKPDCIDELRKIYNEDIIPVVKKFDGMIDAMLMEPANEEDDFISCGIWESKEYGEAYEASGTYEEMVGKVAHTFAGPPTLKTYEVRR